MADLDDKIRGAILPAVALFLKKLHGVDESTVLSMGAQEQTFNRADIEKIIYGLKKRVQKIIDRKVFPLNEKMFLQEIKTAEKIIFPKLERCLVHGDLDTRHLLFDGQQLSAVIDWGDMGLNHKAVDLDIIWTFFPSEYHTEFFKIYGHVEENTWQYARFLGIYCAFTLSLYAHDIQDTLMLKESLNAIKRINPEWLCCTKDLKL